jgi:acyl-CoA synthetase (NDP forming)
MGIYVPKLGIRQGWSEQPIGEAGPVGLISQSGTHSMFISMLMQDNGVGLSKGVSIGNSVILDASDYLKYFGDDPETEIVAGYIEGVRDGRRFFETLREVAKRKPVVLWKGGQTEAGARATASHTASLATSNATWNAMMRQCGAIAVDTIDELVDVCKALIHVRPGTGTRVGLMAMTGGPSVAMTDAFARQGLDAPPLSEESYAQLAEFFNVIGGSYRNPLDIGGTLRGDTGNLSRMFEILEADPNVDTIVMDVAAGFAAQRWRDRPETFDELIAELVAHRERSKKPFVTTMHPMWMEEIVATLRPKLTAKGIPSFHSFDRAARALRLVRDYHAGRE